MMHIEKVQIRNPNKLTSLPSPDCDIPELSLYLKENSSFSIIQALILGVKKSLRKFMRETIIKAK